jgi:hypothetical protein
LRRARAFYRSQKSVSNKNDKEKTHVEGQVGPSVSFIRKGGPDDSKTDLAVTAVVNVANMPGSQGRFSWSLLSLRSDREWSTPPFGE